MIFQHHFNDQSGHRADFKESVYPQQVLSPLASGQLSRRSILRQAVCFGAVAALLWASTAHAGVRLFPMKTQRGHITFINPPHVDINGQSRRLGPGTRIHDAKNNRLIFANTLKGKDFMVNYVLDGTGTIREIWILTPEEIAQPLP
jgi:hypothetical protein